MDEPFLWGLWASLSERSYNRLRETLDDPVPGETCFGWVCNTLNVYSYEKNRPADAVDHAGNRRPLIILHREAREEDEDDPLVLDQRNGISIARAQELAERALHGS